MDDDLRAKAEAEVASGEFRKEDIMFKGSKAGLRRALTGRLASGDLSIVTQFVDVFPEIQTTYVRPPFESVAALLEQGYVLELPHVDGR